MQPACCGMFVHIVVCLSLFDCLHSTSGLGTDNTGVLTAVSGIDERGKITQANTTLFSERRLGSTDGTVVNGVCVDYTAVGHFSSRRAALSGIPSGFVARPATISPCELESLHTECVHRINMYRSGQLKFSDGSSDSNVMAGLSPLQELTGSNQCSTHQALGDLVRAKPLGFGCAGAHYTAFTCPTGGGAQNSCCSWHQEATYSGVKQRLFQCLQSMWDEGITPGQKGHWETMRSTTHNYASCGFAWDEDGQVTMNQDFFNRAMTGECSCKGKRSGDADGCGGICVGCREPAVNPCQDDDRTNARSSSCSGPISPSGRPYCTCPDVGRFGWCTHSWIASSCPVTCNSCPVLQPTCPSSSEPTTSIATTKTIATTITTTMTITTVSGVVPAGIQSGDVVFLKTLSGSGSHVDVEGVSVRARWEARGNWQALEIEKAPSESKDATSTCYSAPADHSRKQCETCFHSDQCPMGYYCCPYMRKCVNSGSMSCFSPIANCRPMCYDSECDKAAGCSSCTQCDSRATDDWLAWANLLASNSGSPTPAPCTVTSAPPSVPSIIRSGDTVYLKTHTGAHIDVEGDSVQARWTDMGGWQALQIEKPGGGAIMPDDVVCFRAHTGKHIHMQEGTLRAQWDDCGAWQAMQIEKEYSNAVWSGDALHLVAHNGNMIDIEGDLVQARWHDRGTWQTLVIESDGGRAIFSGDTVFLQGHTGKHLDVESNTVMARWHDHGALQKFTIEKIGGGPIFPGDTCYLLAHTGKHVAVEGTAVTATWHDQGGWQALVIEAADRRRLQAAATLFPESEEGASVSRFGFIV